MTPCRGAVADDDHFVQIPRVFGHDDGNFGFDADLFHDRLVADVGKFQIVGVLDTFNKIGSVGPGCRTVEAPFNDYGDADQRLTFLIHNLAAY